MNKYTFLTLFSAFIIVISAANNTTVAATGNIVNELTQFVPTLISPSYITEKPILYIIVNFIVASLFILLVHLVLHHLALVSPILNAGFAVVSYVVILLLSRFGILPPLYGAPIVGKLETEVPVKEKEQEKEKGK